MMGDKSSRRFIVGVILGLGFSMAVILSTVGIMDGFEETLKKGLRLSSGDISISSRSGFFKPQELNEQLEEYNISKKAAIVRTEGFLIREGSSRGVLIKGISSPDFRGVTGRDIKLSPGSIAIGKQLAVDENLKIGDTIVIALAKGKGAIDGVPVLKRFSISDIVSHEVYQQDSRFCYVDIDYIQDELKLGDKVNVLTFSLPSNYLSVSSEIDDISDFADLLYHKLYDSYRISPYWSEFSTLIRAVEVEKVMLSVVLQLIVVISIFNIIAFIVFLNEKKASSIFLFRAIGLTQKELNIFWRRMTTKIWFFGILVSLVLVYVFNYLLQNLSFLKLPGEVYTLEVLEIHLDFLDYIIVFASAYIWLMLIVYFILRRFKKKAILHGLRQEFS